MKHKKLCNGRFIKCQVAKCNKRECLQLITLISWYTDILYYRTQWELLKQTVKHLLFSQKYNLYEFSDF